MKPIQQKSLIPESAFAKIFSNVEVIYSTIHLHIATSLQEMREHLLSESDSEAGEKNRINFGDVFQSLNDALPLYKVYCTNYDSAIETLAKYKSKKEFLSFLSEKLEVSECRGNSLNEYLSMPLKRLCEYPVYFKQFIDQIGRACDEYRQLSKIIKLIEDTVNDISKTTITLHAIGLNLNIVTLEESTRRSTILKQKGASKSSPNLEYSKMDPVEEMESRLVDFPGKLSQTGRILKHHGRLHKVPYRMNTDGKVVRKSDAKDRYVLVFNDILVYCKRGQLIKNTKKRLLVYRGQVSMGKLTVTELKNHPDSEIAFVMESVINDNNTESKTKAWIMFCSTTIERDYWMKLLKEEVNYTLKKRKESTWTKAASPASKKSIMSSSTESIAVSKPDPAPSPKKNNN
eukprot:TRINITY_DN4240_c0_g1_i1.p1 TRINITY_DN4240_c0_g1~~TRINITY_DN4240_c0_g1_i1.p1  ORF type:complete len:402 (-),score=43.78 TRINITY_DN4240_c0_g1_i1:393-1598(-)